MLSTLYNSRQNQTLLSTLTWRMRRPGTPGARDGTPSGTPLGGGPGAPERYGWRYRGAVENRPYPRAHPTPSPCGNANRTHGTRPADCPRVASPGHTRRNGRKRRRRSRPGKPSARIGNVLRITPTASPALRSGLACISHTPPAAAADPLAVTGCTPSSRLDVVSALPAPSSGPCIPSPRRLDTLATDEFEKCRLGQAALRRWAPCPSEGRPNPPPPVPRRSAAP
jgi:hypothetical protein